MKTRKLSALVAFLGSLLAAGWAAAAELKVGDSFPDLAAFKLEGQLPADLTNKIIVVDFWASWCGPCRQSFPALNELHAKYAAQGIVIIGVNVDEDATKMAAFLKKTPANFTIVRDAAQKLVAQVGVPGMPSSFVIGRDGKVRFIHAGFHGAETQKKYVAELDSLLAPK